MHANYHRKDSAIIQEGFQRLRATEECRTEYCVFFGQKTTHFHCRREHCTYTFKNKADMGELVGILDVLRGVGEGYFIWFLFICKNMPLWREEILIQG